MAKNVNKTKIKSKARKRSAHNAMTERQRKLELWKKGNKAMQNNSQGGTLSMSLFFALVCKMKAGAA